jgi:hypothetical protein
MALDQISEKKTTTGVLNITYLHITVRREVPEDLPPPETFTPGNKSENTVTYHTTRSPIDGHSPHRFTSHTPSFFQRTTRIPKPPHSRAEALTGCRTHGLPHSRAEALAVFHRYRVWQRASF